MSEFYNWAEDPAMTQPEPTPEPTVHEALAQYRAMFGPSYR